MIYDKDAKKWNIDFKGELIEPSQYEADKEFLEKFNEGKEKIKTWVDRDIGELNTKLTSDEAIFGDSYFLSFIRALQFELAKKELDEKTDI